MHNKKVQSAGWRLGRTTLANMRGLATVLLAQQIIVMHDSALLNVNSSNGTNIFHSTSAP